MKKPARSFAKDARAPEPGRAHRPTERHAETDGRPGLIYGLLPVTEALRANARRIDKIFLADGARERRLDEIIDLARAAGVLVERVPRERLDRLAGRAANHQGVAAVASAGEYVSVDDVLENAAAAALIVVLDGVEDPRNLGAVLRSAECAGADGVIIPERRAAGLTDTVVKSSAGATEYVKVAKTSNLNRLIEDLKRRGIWVVGTRGDASMSYTDWDWTQPSALVLGAEGSGLHRLVRENCDVLVKIPMYGKIDSLNVSVAAGVILFEARRQRGTGE
ncbi:MAG: 23S rRNA (guanosine(2251)-2'-O)-methyltransferase RlmB [Pyrinomonadaceae bacterium]